MSVAKNIAPAMMAVIDRKKLLRAIDANPLFRNALSLSGAEVSTRASRIIAMIFAARALTPEMFGFAAIALTAHELIKVITQNGVFQMVIKSSESDLAATTARAHQLIIITCTIAAILQLSIGGLIALNLNSAAILGMSAALAVVFVVMPFGLIRLALSARENNLHKNARVAHRQVSVENVLTLVLAIAGAGAWALVLPKALAMPVWLAGARRCHDWRPDPKVAMRPLQDFRVFCVPLLFSEGLKAARTHLDKAIIAGLLGIEALGVYFFAMNAGLGLSLTFGQAVASCLMPHLCVKGRDGGSILKNWRAMAPYLFIGGAFIFALQAIAVFYYVPFIYGDQWRDYVSLVAILCLGATPRFLTECTAQLLRAVDSTMREAATTTLISVTSLIAVVIGAMAGGLLGAVVAVTAAAWATEIVASHRNYLAIKGMMK